MQQQQTSSQQVMRRTLCIFALHALASSLPIVAFAFDRRPHGRASSSLNMSNKSKALTQRDYQAKLVQDAASPRITSKDVATLPKPGKRQLHPPASRSTSINLLEIF